MNKTKIAVFVSGGGTNLQALIDAEKAGKIPHGEIALVVASKPGVFALERAAKAGIKSVVVERKKYPDKPSFEADLKKTLDEISVSSNALNMWIEKTIIQTKLDGELLNEELKRYTTK